jgi:hypothetical protein
MQKHPLRHPMLAEAKIQLMEAGVVGTPGHRASAKTKSVARREGVKRNDMEDSVETKPIPIQWPSEQQIHQVSRWLLTIKSLGVKCETQGDYFNSGDLAYQLQEIMRSTLDLLHKCQRVSKRDR